ncbi:NAD(P)-dependent dehydrogenase (short-subunit alcohol dehydrogenase family) [Oxalobacteraceae bacterium GrIS 2.11]
MGIEVNFEGKIALITGASSGLGARFAKVLAEAGAQVVLAARRIDRLKELRAEIEAEGGAAHMVELDVTDYSSIKSAIAHAETEAGPIDILINNAGVSNSQRLLDVTPDDYAYIMDTNQRGAFFVAQETAKRMVARAKGDPKKQHRIINIASVAGMRVIPGLGSYCISKAAVIQMTRAMALEWGKYGINVNAICPGYISTEINQGFFDTDEGRKLMASLPRNRVGTPQDLDGLLLLLAAEESRFLNGTIVTADDGMSVM